MDLMARILLVLPTHLFQDLKLVIPMLAHPCFMLQLSCATCNICGAGTSCFLSQISCNIVMTLMLPSVESSIVRCTWVCTCFDDGHRFDCSPVQSSWSWILALTDVDIFDSGDPYNFRWKRSFILGLGEILLWNVMFLVIFIWFEKGGSILTLFSRMPVWGFKKSLRRTPVAQNHQFEVIGEALSQAIQVCGTAVKTVTVFQKWVSGTPYSGARYHVALYFLQFSPDPSGSSIWITLGAILLQSLVGHSSFCCNIRWPHHWSPHASSWGSSLSPPWTIARQASPSNHRQ
jgi:hypothetical protein